MPRNPPLLSARWLLISGAAFAAIVLAAHLLSAQVLSLLRSDAVIHGDRTAWKYARGHSSSNVQAVMVFISEMHGTAGILVLTGLGAWGWQRFGHQDACVRLLLAVPAGMLLNVLVKSAVQRIRPDWALVELPRSYSFPSGHVAEATVFYGSLALEAAALHASKTWRFALAFGGVAMIAFVASSRVILGVHFLSDCVGAAVEGALWLGACFHAHPLRQETGVAGTP